MTEAEYIVKVRRALQDWGRQNKLKTALTDSSGVLDLDWGHADFVRPGQVVLVEDEELYVYDDQAPTSTTEILVRRGYNGTTAAAHILGTQVLAGCVWSQLQLKEWLSDCLGQLYPWFYQKASFSFIGGDQRSYDLAHAPAASPVAVKAYATTNLITTTVAGVKHGLVVGDAVVLAGLDEVDADTTTYVISDGFTDEAFKVALSVGGVVVDILTNQSGITATKVVGDASLFETGQVETIRVTRDSVSGDNPRDLLAARLTQDSNSVLLDCHIDLTGLTVTVDYNKPYTSLTSLPTDAANLPLLWCQYKAVAQQENRRVRTTPYSGEGGVVPGTQMNTGSFWRERFKEERAALAMPTPAKFLPRLR